MPLFVSKDICVKKLQSYVFNPFINRLFMDKCTINESGTNIDMSDNHLENIL